MPSQKLSPFQTIQALVTAGVAEGVRRRLGCVAMSLTVLVTIAMLVSFGEISRADAGKVEPVGITPGEKVPADIQELLGKLHAKLIDPSLSPQIPETMHKVGDLVSRLLTPEEKQSEWKLIMIDDLQPNAFFTRLEDGTKVVAVHAGLFDILENDDELAFVLGHEIEHAYSELQKYRDGLLKDPAKRTKENYLLQRPVENEVDTKSMLRLQRNGFNPHAAPKAIRRLRDMVGDDSGDESHTSSANRNDTLDLALTGLKRTLGQAVMPDRPEFYKDQFATKFKTEVLHSEAFRKHQLARIEEAIRVNPDPATQVYQALAANTSQAKLSELEYSFSKEHDRILGEVGRLGFGILDPKAKIDTEIRLLKNLDDSFKLARKAVLGEHPQFKSAAQYWELKQIDNMTHSSNTTAFEAYKFQLKTIPDAGMLMMLMTTRSPAHSAMVTLDTMGKIQSKIDELKADLNSGTGTAEHRESVTAALKFEQEKLATEQAHLDLYEYAMKPGSLPRIRELYAKFWGGKRSGDIPHAVNLELVQMHREFSDRIASDRAREVQTLMDLIEAPDAFQPSSDHNYYDLAALDRLTTYGESLKSAQYEKVFSSIARRTIEMAKLPAPLGGIENAIEGISPRGSRSALGRWVAAWEKVDSSHAVQAFQKFYLDLIAQSPNIQVTERLLNFAYQDNGNGFDIIQGRIGFERPFAARFLTPEILQTYDNLLVRDLDQSIGTFNESSWAALSAYSDKLSLMRKLVARGGTATWKEEHIGPWVERVNRMVPQVQTWLESQGAKGVTEHEARAYLLARSPQIFKLLGSKSGTTPAELLKNVSALATRLPAKTPLAGTLNYPDILNSIGRDLQPSAMASFAAKARPILNMKLLQWTTPEGLSRAQLADARADQAAWLLANDPRRVAAMGDLVDIYVDAKEQPVLGKKLYTVRDGIFKARWDRAFERNQKYPMRERARRTAAKFWEEFRGVAPRDLGADHNKEFIELFKSILPALPVDRLEFAFGYHEALNQFVRTRLLKDYTVDGSKQVRGTIKAWSKTMELRKFEDEVKSQIGDRFDYSTVLETVELNADDPKMSGRLLADSLAFFIDSKMRSDRTDALFERLWKRAQSDPTLLEAFRDPKWVKRIHFDENRVELAKWQFEDRFHVAEAKRTYKNRRAEIPDHTVVRDQIKVLRDFADAQFETASGTKNEVINWLEGAYMTNQSETTYLSERKVRYDNWYESRQLVALDAPAEVSKLVETQLDRLELLQYLIGSRQAHPEVLARKVKKPEVLKQVQTGLEKAKVQYAKADVYTRTYLIQPFLDSKEGILSDPDVKLKLMNFVMGDSQGNLIARKFIDSYFKAIPEGEQRSILAYILASMETGAGQKSKGVSVTKILEAMGPFGIKSGQFLRTSGLVPESLRADLEKMFDQALPPSRDDVFSKMKDIFGEKLVGVKSVRQIVGSGSINFIVLADLVDPVTGKVKTCVVRFLRETTEGRAYNEDQIWQSVIADLKNDPDPKVRKLAELGNEAREDVMTTLGKGGLELNLGIERDAYPKAKLAYEAPRDPKSGFNIDVAKPLESFQSMVPEKYSNQVSIYEFYENRALKDIPSPKLRAALSAQIIEAEFKAMFEHGTFDPDGHPGNWLVDLKNRRLVRIDYAKMLTISDTNRIAFRDTLAMLVQPHLGTSEIGVLSKSLPDVFQFNGISPEALQQKIGEALTGIAAQEKLPDYKAPHERLFYVRNQLEDYFREHGTEVKIRLNPATRAALSSLSRTFIYRERSGDVKYAQLLTHYLEINTSKFLLKAAGAEISKKFKGFGNQLTAIGRCMAERLHLQLQSAAVSGAP